MKSINDANIIHVLDELTRISVLISANAFYWYKEQDEQKSKNGQSLLSFPLWAMRKKAVRTKQRKSLDFVTEIDAAIENNPDIKASLRLLRLRQLLDFSANEMDIFLICLIREFDVSYRDLWASMQNNLDETYTFIETILNLLSFDLVEKLRMYDYLKNGSKLFKYNLLERANAESNSAGFTPECTVKVNPRGLDYLLSLYVAKFTVSLRIFRAYLTLAGLGYLESKFMKYAILTRTSTYLDTLN